MDYTLDDVKEDIKDLKMLAKRREPDCVEKLIVWLAEVELKRIESEKPMPPPNVLRKEGEDN